MSSDETKAPLTEPAPLYPPYEPYNGQYQMHSVNRVQQDMTSPQDAPLQPRTESQADSDSGDAKNNGELEDGDDLLPGTGPGGIPDKHFNLDFEHCFTEHKSTKTFGQLYTVVGLVYKYTKLTFYHIFVILIGIPMAIIWAIVNGIMVFAVVWLWGPALKLTVLWVYAVAPAFTAPLQAVLAPLADVVARIFRQIRVRSNITGSFMTNIHPKHMV